MFAAIFGNSEESNDTEMPQLQQDKEPEEEKPMKEEDEQQQQDEIIDQPTEDITLQANCLGCGGSISFDKDADITQAYCSDECKPQTEHAKPDSNMLCSPRDHCVRCETPVTIDEGVKIASKKYCSQSCVDKERCDPCGSADDEPVEEEEEDAKAVCKYCGNPIGETIVFNQDEGDSYCSEHCMNTDKDVQPTGRTTRSRNRTTISSDRELMFNRLESNIDKSIAGHDRLEQPRLTDHEKDQIRNLVKTDYRSIPDSQVAEKQNFIIYKVPVKVKKVIGLYKDQKREKQRQSQELRKKLLEENIAARALKRAENKRKAKANKKSEKEEEEPVKPTTETGMTLVY